MIKQEALIEQIVRVARKHGYKIDSHARTGEVQIDFGNKKLHAGHLKAILPGVLSNTTSIAKLIDSVVPGRPCSHRPMRQIIDQLKREGHLP